MEKKINIVELLKDCPKGMELDCLLFKDAPVYFNRITNSCHYPIEIEVEHPDGTFEIFELSKEGCIYDRIIAKCVIFPKGKTTWEGFIPPYQFKDGDVLATDLGSVFYLNTRLNNDEYYGCYVGIGGDGSFHICEPFAYKECCGLATEEEKQKLFQAIKDNGYKWNAETKTLEKVLNKFDITTLIPFESRVLVRDCDHQYWRVSFFGFFKKDECVYDTVRGIYRQCIPYEGNERLLGTNNDCDEFYKIWK